MNTSKVRGNSRLISNLIVAIVMSVILSSCGLLSDKNQAEDKLQAGWLSSFDERVNYVRYGHPAWLEEVTYGEAYEHFFSEPEWRAFDSTDNKSIVEFSGGCTYNNEPAEVYIQFELFDDNTFNFSYCSLAQDNKKIQCDSSIIVQLLYNPFESYANDVLGKTIDESTQNMIISTYYDLLAQETYHNDSSSTKDTNTIPDMPSANSHTESSSNCYSSSDFLGGWGSSGGRDELYIEKEGNNFKVTWSGSYSYNSGGVTEMTCTFTNGKLEFNDGTHTTYLIGDYNDEEASIVDYTNNNGFFYLCSPDEIDSYYDKFINFTVYRLARAWDGYGDSAVPLDNDPYLLLIQEPIETYASSEYVIWYSSQIRLSENSVSFLSDTDKRLAVNEIYARHGRKFNDPELQQHFNQCSWYRGTVEPSDFNENVLSSIEKYNLQLLAPANGQNASAMKDPVGTYVGDDGVTMIFDENGPLLGYLTISKNYYGTYDVWIGESYKGAPCGTVNSIYANTPFYFTSEYKGYVSTRTLIFDGNDTITVADEYQNVSVYHRITDDIKNHINYGY